jgi:hypothetical protein
MSKGKEKEDVLYRVVKFEIKPTPEQLTLLGKISDNLWLVWDEALAQRQKNYETHIAPFYEAIKEAEKRQDREAVVHLKADLRAALKAHPLTFYDQVNALTPRREQDSGFASVPRNWQEETLDTLDAGFKSFVALRANQDPKARPPKLRSAWHFCEIPGRSGFSIRKDEIVLAPNIFGKEMLRWPIPQEYQAFMLARASKVKKFTLYRDPSDMREKGRFWISLAYEIPRPKTKPFNPGEAVYVSLGASSIGIVSPRGEEVIPLWRADKHWMPLTDAITLSLEGKVSPLAPRPVMRPIQKNSKKCRKLQAKRRKMFGIMGNQQKQDRREIVAIDLLEAAIEDEIFGHGVHFVVSDLIVRSKPGKLADGSKKERGGVLGLNWSAQNTGSIAYLAQWLEEKAKEYGGTVCKHKLASALVPAEAGIGHENKILMARALRDDFLRSFDAKKAS